MIISCSKCGNKFLNYSNCDTPYCKICGFNNIKALHIDHINNDGYIYRQTTYKNCHSGSHFYRSLMQQNYPTNPFLQILCFNCNQIKKYDKNGENI